MWWPVICGLAIVGMFLLVLYADWRMRQKYLRGDYDKRI